MKTKILVVVATMICLLTLIILRIRPAAYTIRINSPCELASAITVAAGNGSSFMICSNGSLWAWGRNDFGQLGDGTTTDRHSPVHIMDNVVSVSAGSLHTMAITEDGILWGWGNNNSGQRGTGARAIDGTVPTRIMEDVKMVSTGSSHTIAITMDGELWGWGRNFIFSHLVNNTNARVSWPSWIMDEVVYASVGLAHIMVIKYDGSLWGWGGNHSGQLGDGTIERRSSPTWIMDDLDVVSAGDTHSMAIMSNGSLWGWGGGGSDDSREIVQGSGQLGDGTIMPSHTPIQIMDDVTSVAIGFNHMLAVRTDGSIWTWGNNNYGQLGDGTTRNRTSPINITANIPETISAGSPEPEVPVEKEPPVMPPRGSLTGHTFTSKYLGLRFCAPDSWDISAGSDVIISPEGSYFIVDLWADSPNADASVIITYSNSADSIRVWGRARDYVDTTRIGSNYWNLFMLDDDILSYVQGRTFEAREYSFKNIHDGVLRNISIIIRSPSESLEEILAMFSLVYGIEASGTPGIPTPTTAAEAIIPPQHEPLQRVA